MLAARSEDVEHRQQALVQVCQDYWMPLYAFSRRLGHNQHDAEDLTQGFFAYLLEHRVLEKACREMGTLRTYLLKVYQRHIQDVRDRDNAQKRGGGMPVFSLNVEEGENLFLTNLAGKGTPESHYDHAWAQLALRGALQQLGVEEEAAGRGKIFAQLEPHLNPDAETEADYARTTQALNMSVESVRQAVSRLRKKFRDCLRMRIAATLQDPDEERIDSELHALRAALRQ